jgi:hypothetical protein
MSETTTSTEPEVLEFGRYKVSEAPDGGWVLGRRTGTCETCRTHDCGTAAELVHIPAMVIKMARSQGGMLGKLKGLMPGGGGTNG